MAEYPTFLTGGLESVDAPRLPTQKEIDKEPWKYLGYRRFSEFVASDGDFFVVRRFSDLAARVILTTQDRLSELAEKLKALDEAYSTPKATINNGTCRDEMPDRKSLIAEIHVAIMDYYKLLLLTSELGRRPSAPSKSIENVKRWLSNHPGAIDKVEARFVDQEDDLISVLSREQPMIRKVFEKWLTMDTKFLLPLFRGKPVKHADSVDNATVHVWNNRTVDRFAAVVIFIAGSMMFIAPLWILQALAGFRWRLLVITIFIFVFLGVLASSTLGKPFEIMAATAGYSAVLVVFLQFGSHAD